MNCDHADSTPEWESAVVAECLKKGDLPHAAHHLAGVLANDPLRADHLALWTRLAELAGDGLVDLWSGGDGGMWFGAAACRAKALAQSGTKNGGWSLLCQVVAAEPGIPYLAWARGWTLPADAEASWNALRHLLQVHDAHAWNLAWEVVGARVLQRFPGSGNLHTLFSIGLRRAGRLDEARALATHGMAVDPTWFGATTLANACRAVGDVEATELAWTRALQLDPLDHSVLLDWGDFRLDRGEHDGARDRYALALERTPGQPWATSSLLYLDWLANPTIPVRAAIARHLAEHPDDRRARWALGEATPWLGWLPGPSEATANVLQQVLDNGSKTVSMSVSHLEGPSVYLAAARVLDEVDVSIGTIPLPDPRAPLLDAPYTLFTWDGTVPSAALPPPPPGLQKQLQALTHQAYDARNWLDAATPLALELCSDHVEELLALAVNVEPLEGVPHHRWVWLVQHAIGYVLAAAPVWDGPVLDALTSMIAVRNDWLTTAALAGMTARAEVDPSKRELTLGLVLEVLGARPDSGGWEVARPAWFALLRLDPEDEHDLHGAAAQWLDG